MHQVSLFCCVEGCIRHHINQTNSQYFFLGTDRDRQSEASMTVQGPVFDLKSAEAEGDEIRRRRG